jgi:hypothetical protein
MDKLKEDALDQFVDLPEEEKKKVDGAKKVILDEREGLIERVDKVFVTKDGKQLLREHY